MKVLKFGGSSLATPERVERVVEIVRRELSGGPLAVVVSAFGGVTDGLLAAARRASARDEGYRELLEELRRRHLEAVTALARPEDRDTLTATVEAAFGDLEDLTRGAFLLREASPRTLDHVASYGERLSSALVAAALVRAGVEAESCDSRRLVITDSRFGSAVVDEDTTFPLLRERFASAKALQVVTGFIAGTAGGETTTLGRGGSDYTASLLGAALGVEVVELWTDVDGVMSADPRLVPRAFPQPELSYRELAELSHFGAKVVYPQSVHPTRERSIPLVIKNTFRPESPGTRVVDEAADDGRLIRGVTSISPVALLLVEGDGMVGVPGIAMRLFGALARDRISVILISQASSEHSICLAVAPEAVERARRQLEDELELELRLGLIDPLVVEDEMAVLAVVGEQMRERPGISGRLFQVLGDRGVNVRAIAQGSSERNISLVVAAADEARALNAVHDRFFFPRQAPARRRGLELVVVGPGRVGGAFLDQLETQRARLAEAGLEIKVRAILRRGRGLAAADCLDLGTPWREALGTSGDALELEALFEELRRGDGRAALVDCTASSEVPASYPAWLEEGFSVVSANKLPFAGPLATWRRVRAAARASGAGLFFETTVGAGLPVIRTLEDLLATGDRVERVEGTLSGTLSYLCDALAQGVKLSHAVREAHRLGYTEPHPWQDLSGQDVGRKLLILARLLGFDLEPEEVEVEPWLPASLWSGLDTPSFLDALPQADEDFARKREEAAGRRLTYLAQVSAGRARVTLEAVAEGHPAAAIRGTDNFVAFTTERYAAAPLQVRGAGAGPAVTAAGLFGDVLRAAREAPGA